MEHKSQPEVLSFEEEPVNIYPNPVTDILNVEVTETEKYTLIRIFDAFGRIVKEIAPVTSTNQINVQNFPFGTYTLMLMGNDVMKSFRFIRL